jgi:hypothetical protein
LAIEERLTSPVQVMASEWEKLCMHEAAAETAAETIRLEIGRAHV